MVSKLTVASAASGSWKSSFNDLSYTGFEDRDWLATGCSGMASDEQVGPPLCGFSFYAGWL